MKYRKRIAVIMCNVMYREYQHRILEGMMMQAKALDYDTAIFTLFMGTDEDTDYQFGENQIFNLISFDMFDAVIYAPCSVANDTLRKKITDRLDRECHVPIIALESAQTAYTELNVDDAIAFERVVDHLIDVHHLKDILCLTGFKGNLQAEERLQGYRNSMQKHGLPVWDDRMIYGDFWRFAAEDLAQQLADKKISMPEGIVCACDNAAIALSNRLIELGIQVPEDILVVGYDSTKEGEDNVPSITTYARPLKRLGIQSVLLAHKLLTGEDAEPVEEDHGILIPAESCGCGENFMQKFTQRQIEIKEVEEYRRLFETCSMAETLNASPTLNHLLEKITEYMYLIPHLKEFYICLCDQWDDFSKNSDETGSYKYYTDVMHLRVAHCGNYTEVVDESFPVQRLMPDFWMERDHPIAYYITPLHFNERCFGYTALGYGKRAAAFDAQYHSWIRNLNNAFEFVRVRNIFSSMNKRLFMASIRDTLTGIFNRKGLNHYAPDLFRKSRATGKPLLVIAADLDGLKTINDTYGHLEGDHAISIVANALNTCFTFGEICARIGGDEFLVVGCEEYTEEQIQQYLEHIQRFLARYNETSDKPYTIEASVGYVCRPVAAADTFQNIVDEADALMYENKISRKKNRKY